MSTFGQWYEAQKQQQIELANNPLSSSSSVTSSLLSQNNFLGGIFNTEDGEGTDEEMGGSNSSSTSALMPNISAMKQTLEQQLPQKICGMNYQQRFQAFTILLLISALFFFLGFTIGVPMLTIRPQKFAICFTMGSLTFMSSFALLRGPQQHLQGMLDMDRLPFTTIYVSSMVSTLYFCSSVGGMSGYVVVLVSSVVQICSLIWYLITFLPGGKASLGILIRGMIKILKPVFMGCMKVWSMIVTKCFGWLIRSS